MAASAANRRLAEASCETAVRDEQGRGQRDDQMLFPTQRRRQGAQQADRGPFDGQIARAARSVAAATKSPCQQEAERENRPAHDAIRRFAVERAELLEERVRLEIQRMARRIGLDVPRDGRMHTLVLRLGQFEVGQLGIRRAMRRDDAIVREIVRGFRRSCPNRRTRPARRPKNRGKRPSPRRCASDVSTTDTAGIRSASLCKRRPSPARSRPESIVRGSGPSPPP